MYDILVFISRFQPINCVHVRVIRHALKNANYVVILCAGVNHPRSLRSPFIFKEQETMVKKCFSETENKRLAILPLKDMLYDKIGWQQHVEHLISGWARDVFDEDEKNCLDALKVGFLAKKGMNSYFHSTLLKWDKVEIEEDLDAPSRYIQNHIFSNPSSVLSSQYIPKQTLEFLEKFTRTSCFSSLEQEYSYIKAYKKVGSKHLIHRCL